MTMPIELSAEVRQKVKRLSDEGHDLTERRDALDERIAQVKAELADLVPPGTFDEGGLEVRRPSRSFSDEKAKRMLPSDLYRALLANKVDRRRAKEVLPKELYDALMEPGSGSKAVVFK